MALTRDDALKVFHERYRSPELVVHRVANDNNGWGIRYSLTTEPVLRPSRLVLISKIDGRILFDGSASDEG